MYEDILLFPIIRRVQSLFVEFSVAEVQIHIDGNKDNIHYVECNDHVYLISHNVASNTAEVSDDHNDLEHYALADCGPTLP